MIHKSTVLVLGAGASMPYGYSSGHTLRQKLINPKLFAPLLSKQWLSEGEAEEFSQIFMLSGMKSIDAFLARRGRDLLTNSSNSIEKIGKYGIALALRQGKSYGTLFHDPAIPDKELDIDRSDNWYETLWQHLTLGISREILDEFPKNKLAIITFNYDLLLEHYLFTASRNSYRLEPKTALELLSGIKVFHLYGQLSGDPYSDELSYEFDFSKDFCLLNQDIDSIKVINEQRQGSTERFDGARELLDKALRIGFLGFGFDETNV